MADERLTSLPVPDRPYQGPLALDVRDLDEPLPPIEVKRPPKGAPNVLLILLDDVGFGAASAFGGPVHTPTAERLAEGGLKYSRFHTTSLCAPTRAALLSGRNHHSVGMGHITDTAMPVHEDYADPHGAFTGTIAWAQVALGDDDHSHLVDPADHIAAALRHQ